MPPVPSPHALCLPRPCFAAFSWIMVFALGLLSCTPTRSPSPPDAHPSVLSRPASPALPSQPPDTTDPKPTLSKSGPCPEGMVFIDDYFCPARDFTCLRVGRSKPRHPGKCLEFSEDHPCIGAQRRQRFCIDVYEYPNQKGSRPPSMINAWEADLLCREQGKRLCWESEWTQACQGPRGFPYPYGTRRDASKCNIDRTYIAPYQRKLHGPDEHVRHSELVRLDQAVSSGEMEQCKSDFGVHDQTGNFSEWVYLEKPRGRCTWAGTKGGHWVPVRNVCHLTSTRHPESWRYYPLTTRCCADPDLSALPPTPSHLQNVRVWRPPRAHNTLPYLRNHGPLRRGWTPASAP